MMGSGLISCDSNDQQEVNDALQEIQATGGEEGNIDPPEREE